MRTAPGEEETAGYLFRCQLRLVIAGLELADRRCQIRRRTSSRELGERYGEEACSQERPNMLRYFIN
jgi:hypothetical protein